ncbi:trimeric intracellular cation channel family protein [Corallococcus sp. bb12-1]|uniref:trimeric intracellular cation channel family protein n=1 Tax=Corallococcus sp. bb12-1 TaxID=2996784 RepID=UPI00226FC5E7|nr:trimeric intracellular cation channel family protein [Corallococcus sp. bb12-1]MCY1041074.1 trimeric intracellular cation channel family protein [Corallococcus sp. bb12-1]
MLTLPVYLELGAVGLGALSGALHALRRRVDAMGVLALAISTSVGGGMLRDVLLGQEPPAALRSSRFFLAVAACALIAVAFAPWMARLHRALDVVDALLLGVWVVLGLEKALAFGLPLPSAVFLGLVTSVGGGVIRDVLLGEPSAIVAPGELYASVALLCALTYVALAVGLELPVPLAEIISIAFATVLRLLAMWRGWWLPARVDLPHLLDRLQAWRQRRQR